MGLFCSHQTPFVSLKKWRQKLELYITIQRKTFRAVLEGQSDESELEVSDSSDIESDQLSSLQTTVILTQLLRYHTIGRQQTKVSLLLKFQMSLEEVLVEVEIVAKLGDEGSQLQLGLLAGERKISLRMCLQPKMEPFGGLPHKKEVDVACKTK